MTRAVYPTQHLTTQHQLGSPLMLHAAVDKSHGGYTFANGSADPTATAVAPFAAGMVQSAQAPPGDRPPPLTQLSPTQQRPAPISPKITSRGTLRLEHSFNGVDENVARGGKSPMGSGEIRQRDDVGDGGQRGSVAGLEEEVHLLGPRRANGEGDEGKRPQTPVSPVVTPRGTVNPQPLVT
jgi:hypothetical protein